MKIYNFLYYCFYCLTIKKSNDQSHIRALMLQGIMLTNFFVDFFFLLVLAFNIDISKYKFALVIILILNFLVSKLENKYYLDNGKYKLAIEYFESKYSRNTKKGLGLLALFLFLFSTALFIWIGITIGRKNTY